MPNFDVVICTYNRANKVVNLVNQILTCSVLPKKIIVVDSSDERNQELFNKNQVLYIQSSHKNQPYQRLLGSQKSQEEILIFFDDDLEIKNKRIFELILDGFNDEKVIGVTVGIDYQNVILNYHSKNSNHNKNQIRNRKLRLSGFKVPAMGKAGRLGIMGSKPNKKSSIEFFYGPCMSFKREIVSNIINEDLLALYDVKLGKGEDKVISMNATKYGKLLYIPEECLYHPAEESSYFGNMKSFIERVTYSRLFLSKVFAKVHDKSILWEIVIYIVFTCLRILSELMRLIIRPNKIGLDKVKGMTIGLFKSFYLKSKSSILCPNINWAHDIENDLSSNKS